MTMMLVQLMMTLTKDDVFKLATFLDPNFGLRCFQPTMRDHVIGIVKAHLRQLLPKNQDPKAAKKPGPNIQSK